MSPTEQRIQPVGFRSVLFNRAVEAFRQFSQRDFLPHSNLHVPQYS
jgi:hypothetical protein